jgi:hypothetical protein
LMWVRLMRVLCRRCRRESSGPMGQGDLRYMFNVCSVFKREFFGEA